MSSLGAARPHKIEVPCVLIDKSNFCELSVAVAISLLSLNSGTGLATVLDVLAEVSVVLYLVVFAYRTRRGFTQKPA